MFILCSGIDSFPNLQSTCEAVLFETARWSIMGSISKIEWCILKYCFVAAIQREVLLYYNKKIYSITFNLPRSINLKQLKNNHNWHNRIPQACDQIIPSNRIVFICYVYCRPTLMRNVLLINLGLCFNFALKTGLTCYFNGFRIDG